MIARYVLLMILVGLFTLIGMEIQPAGGAERVPYQIADWPEENGHHRALVEVTASADAVRVHIPWRRRDLHPDKIDIRIVDTATGERILNMARIAIDRECGDLVFQPKTVPGNYAVYYLPYGVGGWEYMPTVSHLPVENTAEPEWLNKHELLPTQQRNGAWKNLPEAKVSAMQALSEFNRFDPMEIIATAQEIRELCAANGSREYLVFPEDRRFPIRMSRDLPSRWIESGPSRTFNGDACCGEYYAFQVGVYAFQKPLERISVALGDLRMNNKCVIPASAMTCFNLGGVDWTGKSFEKECSVQHGAVQALWFGVQIPADAVPGTYAGTVAIRPQNAEETTIDLQITVSREVLADAGDGEPWRHSRLRWLNSTRAIDDEVVAPYHPLKISGRTIRCLGRSVELGANGLPVSVQSFFPQTVDRLEKQGRELLVEPVSLEVETSEGFAPWSDSGFHFTSKTPGAVSWDATSRSGPLTLRCSAEMEFDGYLEYKLTLQTARPVDVNDIHLEIPLRREVTTFSIGMGREGGYRPDRWEWKWDPAIHQDSLWVGTVNAGLQLKLKGPNYHRPLVNIYYDHLPLDMPEGWVNDGRGGCLVDEPAPDRTVIHAFSGARTLMPGREYHFDFTLLITPLKTIDTDEHWNVRYFHAYEPIAKIKAAGANTINIHHGNELNPYINYPFLATDKLAAYVHEGHENGMKVKIYDTVRELTNHVVELWALRSLNFEIFAHGPGGGHAWLQEHLDQDYISAWYQHYPKGEGDAAIITSGMSRWHNYYLEGLSWLLKNVEIDGIYIDDVAYDREVMKRVRKIFDRERPGCLIDLHSWNHYNNRAKWANCINLYMENLPYINRIWFGEGFDYNRSPDYWLVEISGIPFGLMGEMLEHGGNPWRGMLYGMTSRLPWSGDPRSIWKVWDEFGIQDAEMFGYWVDACPVRTDHRDVLATVYRREDGKALVSLASWAKENVECALHFDWKVLGIDPAKVKIYAPAIENFQPEAAFTPAAKIPVEPAKGRLLILEEKE